MTLSQAAWLKCVIIEKWKPKSFEILQYEGTYAVEIVFIQNVNGNLYMNKNSLLMSQPMLPKHYSYIIKNGSFYKRQPFLYIIIY